MRDVPAVKPQAQAQQAPAQGPDRVLLAGAHRAVIERLRDGLVQRGGLTLLTGPEGVGKTSSMQWVRAHMPPTYSWCAPPRPRRRIDLYAALLPASSELTAALEHNEALEPLREAFGTWLRNRALQDLWSILVLDDADELDAEVLAEVDVLAGLEPMLQMVLVARNEEFLSAVPAIALAPRVRARAVLRPPMPTPAPSIEPVAQPPVTAPSDPAGRRSHSAHQDPFRDSPAVQSIDWVDLLPVLTNPHGIHAEWFRVLHLRLEDWVRDHDGGAKTIVVTGANVNAGKSLVSVNVALQWAHNSWQRVLLIDGDLRRPQFHALFEIPRRPGFADVLAGRCSIDDAAAFVSEIGLHVLPAGRPGNPRQLVNPDRVGKVFEAARQSYDVVIIDSPPLSAMVDSRSMAGAADGVLMVVRSGKTRLEALKRSLESMPEDNLIGAVMNGGDKDEYSAYAEYRKSAGRA